jgi:hypothetical protein
MKKLLFTALLTALVTSGFCQEASIREEFISLWFLIPPEFGFTIIRSAQ